MIVTLGPATAGQSALRQIKARGVDFVRTNMSHSSLADLERSMLAARQIGVPFVIDTEGSQIRTGDLDDEVVRFKENAEVRLWSTPLVGNRRGLCLRPAPVLLQLEEGDILHIDFDTLILRVSDTSTVGQGYVTTRAIAGGHVGRNKAVVLDPIRAKRVELPALSDKDLESIQIGLRENVEHIAVSFVRSAAAVDEVREVTRGRMKIISKIECVDALQRIEEIIDRSDYLLIDRADLGKEIAVERIPFVQKIIIHKARARDTDVFVASNLLETMVERRNPTRAEVQDVINTIVDGAAGLTLAAETAIGKHPIECINMLNRLCVHAESVMAQYGAGDPSGPLVASLAASDHLLENETWPMLASPHGGRLVNRLADALPEAAVSSQHRSIALNRYRQIELEQIAIGTYSPLEGFMGKADLESVLADMRLANGTVWPLPIVLDVSEEVAEPLSVGEEIALTDERGGILGLLELQEKYRYDRAALARTLHGTDDPQHRGVRLTTAGEPVLLAGRVTALGRRESAARAYELTPRQTRRLFRERGWDRVLGFQSRGRDAGDLRRLPRGTFEATCCDGVFVHPLVGDPDARPSDILENHERTIEQSFAKGTALLAACTDFCRYAGPRESLFGALCMMNFGCSHVLVDETDHEVWGDPSEAAPQRALERFGELDIVIVGASGQPRDTTA